MTRIAIATVLFAASAMLGTGCTAAMETYRGITGAQYGYEEIQPPAASYDVQALAAYTRFDLGQFTDDMGGRVPRDFFEYLPGEFQTALVKWKMPNDPRGKALLIRGRVLHFESESLGGMLVSPMVEVVARVELVDKASGKVLGTANCIGRSTARTTQTVRNMSEGMGRAIVSWIDSRYPKAGRE